MLMVGFQGTTLTDDLVDLLDDDLVTGVILFSRNIESLSQLRALNKKIRKHRHDVVIAIDQEGGPVQRLKEGVPHVPPMRDVTDENHAHRIGKELGVALRELGFTMNLAPVLDVDTNPDSPVIGERSFGPDPLRVARLGVAMARGLGEAGILACGKHFPGHGDTALDSHVTMPVVQHGLDRLRRVEIPPFRAAINANIPALMSAHILVPALDPDLPATLSPSVVTDLLRHELGFEGVLLSDDLEMKAITERYPIDRAVTLCVEAGIDQLLVCHNLELQRKALATLRKSPPSRLGISLDRIDSMVRKAL